MEIRPLVVADRPDWRTLGGNLEATLPPVRIIAARCYAVKPMTAEEAAMDLSDRTDQFVVFRDADTNRLGVLIKGRTETSDWIEP